MSMIKISLKKQVINKQTLLSLCLFTLLFGVFALPIHASTSATVTATVTVQNISVSVSDGTVVYGTLGLNSSAGTNGTDTQTATNNGNVTEDLLIRGQNTAAWTLTGSAGDNEYVHRFCNASAQNCSTPPTNYDALTTNNQTLSSSVSASGTVDFDLHITTPSTSSSFVEQSVDVTVTATAS
jgi:hypothetical protein